jgi:predicted lipase
MLFIDGLKNKKKCHDAQAIITQQDTNMYIAFRGSMNISDFKDALNVKPIETSSGIIHAGFMDQFKSLEHDIQSHILLRQLSDIPIHNIYLTGHSLGGAVALISSVMLSTFLQTKIGAPNIHCYTFGTPVMGDDTFFTSLVQSCLHLKCVELTTDIIPQIPLHPQLQRVTSKPFSMVIDPPPGKAPWDIWGNHSCLTYLYALNHLDKNNIK